MVDPTGQQSTQAFERCADDSRFLYTDGGDAHETPGRDPDVHADAVVRGGQRGRGPVRERLRPHARPPVDRSRGPGRTRSRTGASPAARSSASRPVPRAPLILLTSELSDRPASFTSSIAIAPWQAAADKSSSAWVGFRLAARGRFGDYRDDAVYGKGIEAGLRADGSLFIGDVSNRRRGRCERRCPPPNRPGRIGRRLAASPGRVRRAGPRARASTALNVPDPREVRGAIGLVCSDAPCRINRWDASGSKIDAHDDRAFGPILFTQYTLSRRVMKLTAQMAPIGPSESQEVKLAVRAQGSAGAWREAGRATIDPMARTATFRLTNWDDASDHEYRVSYASRDTKGQTAPATFDGTIRRDPRSKPRTVVAAFTGNNDLGFPHADVVRHVTTFEPDLLDLHRRPDLRARGRLRRSAFASRHGHARLPAQVVHVRMGVSRAASQHPVRRAAGRPRRLPREHLGRRRARRERHRAGAGARRRRGADTEAG